MATRGWERDEDLARREDVPGPADAAPSTQEGGGDTGNADAPVVTQKKRRNILRESHLVSAEGLKKVRRTFPYQVSADVTGREAQALASLIKMYKQWAFDLYPGLNFEDFVDRTESLAKGHQVQGLMMELREKERVKAVKRREQEEEKEEQSDSEGEEAML